ncbi:tRNA(Ile)-lysidine synthase [Sporobacter termitidis DSM 10068]|uniref:tRNA(Ile)-lysidine synthase n=1 Tax=Sporobacter termitidis DSM 10068 TaxID=1123282 RepID=A0A1M5Y698_9FIRM|nr:tRNA lysidine(34) synthetase TilS [Sporobacter termitidis]SHI07577.1 tRNA(Ile)-lysidine synthase [Sporobacter termitidis DSM 10068]
MELLQKITDFAGRHGMLPPKGLVLAAVSGGADSMCLLQALIELSEKAGFTVAAAHFNHLLRGAESDGDEAFVARFCLERGIPCHTERGDVRGASAARGLGIEAAARELRYDFFGRTAEKTSAARIATAHTADDNAETVLLNLTRGAGAGGLSGIPPRRGKIIRPMLTVTRGEVLDFLASRSVPFVEDASNSLDIYNRNKIRHHVVPVLRDINPRFAESVASGAALLREDDDYLNGLAAQYIAAHSDGAALDARALLALPRPVSGRVIRKLAGAPLSARHVADVLELCARTAPSGEISLPSGTVHREYGRIVFNRPPDGGDFEPVVLRAGASAVLPELGLAATCRKKSCSSQNSEKINNSFTTFLFKYASVCGNIVIRPRKTGDKIELFGGNGTKTLKKLFIEKRIPARRRALIPVIADDNGVLAVYGIGFDVRTSCKAGDTTLEINFKETGHEK